jgi:2-methylcitrate dehydratase PrpD
VHPTIDCALRLRNEYGVTSENLERLVIAVGEGPMGLLGAPLEVKAHPRNVVDSQFSLAWGASVAISRGHPGLNDYTEEAIRSDDILSVSSRIEMELDTSLNSTGLEPVRMTACLKDGTKHTVYTDTATGSPERPISFEQSEVKFRGLVEGAARKISKANADKVVSMVKNLENVADIRDLIRLLVWEN